MSDVAAVTKSKKEETKEERAARKAAKKANVAVEPEAAALDATQDQAVESTAVQAETKEEKKARRKAEKAAAPTTEATEETTEVTEPAAGTSTAGAAEPEAVEEVEKKAKKSKKDKKTRKEPRILAPPEDMIVSAPPTAPETTAVPASPKAEGKKRKRDSEAAPVPTDGTPSKPEKRSKKDKKLREEKAAAEAMDRADKESAAKVETPAVKKDASSPYEDEELDEQSKKAIGYAHLHSVHHLRSGTSQPAPGQGWKFNKAKQGWLIRNFFNLTTIPEKYVELVVGYLTTIQGGGRKALFTEAKKQLEAPAPVAKPSEEVVEPEVQPETSTESEVPSAMEVDGETKAAAGPDAVAETTEAETEAEATPVEDEAAKQEREAKAGRAKTLLKALNATDASA